jgi:hypothetical protein
MSKQIESRNYPMADSDLKQVADKLKISITRDLPDFATRNYDQHGLDAFQLLIDHFDTSSTDQELVGILQEATIKKNELVQSVQKSIRIIRNMAEITYGGKGKYNTFGFEDLTKLTDNELVRMGRRVLRVSNKLLAELTPQGLSAAQLTELEAMINNLDIAIDVIGDAEENRDLETQDRIIKGNDLWKEMGRLASIGKSLYEDSNEAKFNDYVLVGTSPKNAVTPPVQPA